MVPVDDGLAAGQVDPRQRRVVAVLVEVVEPQDRQPEPFGEVRLARPGRAGQDDHLSAHTGHPAVSRVCATNPSPGEPQSFHPAGPGRTLVMRSAPDPVHRLPRHPGRGVRRRGELVRGVREAAGQHVRGGGARGAGGLGTDQDVRPPRARRRPTARWPTSPARPRWSSASSEPKSGSSVDDAFKQLCDTYIGSPPEGDDEECTKDRASRSWRGPRRSCSGASAWTVSEGVLWVTFRTNDPDNGRRGGGRAGRRGGRGQPGLSGGSDPHRVPDRLGLQEGRHPVQAPGQRAGPRRRDGGPA